MPRTSDDIIFLHHALLFRGDKATLLLYLEKRLGVSFTSTPNQDISFTTFDSFGIDEVRTLAYTALTKPILREFFLSIVVADTITFEAQNALLKLTEDPPAHAQFIFCIPSSFPILPTLRSRFVEHSVKEIEDVVVSTTDKTLQEKLKEIAVLIKDKNNAGMEAMLVHAEFRMHTTHKASPASRALLLVRKYIESRGASSKMLLEHVAISEAE